MFKLNPNLRVPEIKVPSTTLAAIESWQEPSSNVILARTNDISNEISLTLARVYFSEDISFVLVVYSDEEEYGLWEEGLSIMIPPNNYRTIHLTGAEGSPSGFVSSAQELECLTFTFIHIKTLEAQFPLYERLRSAGCVPLRTESFDLSLLTEDYPAIGSSGLGYAVYPLLKNNSPNVLPYSRAKPWDLLVLSLRSHSFTEDRTSVYALNAIYARDNERMVFLKTPDKDEIELWSLLAMVSGSASFYDEPTFLHSYVADDVFTIQAPDHFGYETLVTVQKNLIKKRAAPGERHAQQPAPRRETKKLKADFEFVMSWDRHGNLESYRHFHLSNPYLLYVIPNPARHLFPLHIKRDSISEYATAITQEKYAYKKLEAVNSLILWLRHVVTPFFSPHPLSVSSSSSSFSSSTSTNTTSSSSSSSPKETNINTNTSPSYSTNTHAGTQKGVTNFYFLQTPFSTTMSYNSDAIVIASIEQANRQLTSNDILFITEPINTFTKLRAFPVNEKGYRVIFVVFGDSLETKAAYSGLSALMNGKTLGSLRNVACPIRAYVLSCKPLFSNPRTSPFLYHSTLMRPTCTIREHLSNMMILISRHINHIMADNTDSAFPDLFEETADLYTDLPGMHHLEKPIATISVYAGKYQVREFDGDYENSGTMKIKRAIAHKSGLMIALLKLRLQKIYEYFNPSQEVSIFTTKNPEFHENAINASASFLHPSSQQTSSASSVPRATKIAHALDGSETSDNTTNAVPSPPRMSALSIFDPVPPRALQPNKKRRHNIAPVLLDSIQTQAEREISLMRAKYATHGIDFPETPGKCPLCRLSILTPAKTVAHCNTEAHRKMMDPFNPYVTGCNECSLAFDRPIRLLSHTNSKRHLKINFKTSCFTCNIPLVTYDTYAEHVVRCCLKSTKPETFCFSCNTQFKKITPFLRHLCSHSPLNLGVIHSSSSSSGSRSLLSSCPNSSPSSISSSSTNSSLNLPLSSSSSTNSSLSTSSSSDSDSSQSPSSISPSPFPELTLRGMLEKISISVPAKVVPADGEANYRIYLNKVFILGAHIFEVVDFDAPQKRHRRHDDVFIKTSEYAAMDDRMSPKDLSDSITLHAIAACIPKKYHTFYKSADGLSGLLHSRRPASNGVIGHYGPDLKSCISAFFSDVSAGRRAFSLDFIPFSFHDVFTFHLTAYGLKLALRSNNPMLSTNINKQLNFYLQAVISPE